MNKILEKRLVCMGEVQDVIMIYLQLREQLGQMVILGEDFFVVLDKR